MSLRTWRFIVLVLSVLVETPSSVRP